jgi:hypothetical protein
MSYKEIESIALANVADPDSDYIYRKICRWYSKTFYTPLHTVLNELTFSHVLQAYFEEGFEKMEDEDLKDEMLRTIDPDYDENEEEDIGEFINMIEDEEENKRMKKLHTQSSKVETQSPAKEVVKSYEDEGSNDLDGSGLDDLGSLKDSKDE